MAQEMFNFFPNGIRALLVHDDSIFLKSATVMLSLLHFKVATCKCPDSALEFISSDKVKDVDVVLADAHQVSCYSFDLCTLVEQDFAIPVVYFMSSETAAGVGSQKNNLDRTMQASRFILKKPLEFGELGGLWRVIMWRKFVLDSKNNDGDDGQGSSNDVAAGKRQMWDAGSYETQKHRIMLTPCLKQKFKRTVKSNGIGGHPSELLDHINVQGLRRKHVASHLQASTQKYRGKIQKKNEGGNGGWNPSASAGDSRPKESQFIQSSVLPMFNPQIITGEGLTFTGMPLWPPLFQLPDNDVPSSIAPPVAMPAVAVQPEMYFPAAAKEEGHVAAAMVTELMDPQDTGPVMAAYGDGGDGELEPMIIPDDEVFTFAQLEAVFGELMDTVAAPPSPPPPPMDL